MTVTVSGRHVETELPIEVKIVGDRIADIRPLTCDASTAAALPYIGPGFFDIQINGYQGHWFCSPKLTVDDVVTVTQALLNRGITRYFPTLITASFEALRHGFSVLRTACETQELVASTVAGYHLEGPFISPVDGPRGAHPRQHVRAADDGEFQKLQQASGNRIRLVTLAAESENAIPFIRQCRAEGVVVALGHTGATPEQIRAAVDAGAQMSTHFGNGCHGTLPRHPNYLWEQLADDRLWASVIADGWHVPTSVLSCVLKCKTLKKTILTCDVSGFAGCPVGIHTEGDVQVEVLEDGRVVVAGQRQFLAGSGALTGDCVAHMISACRVSPGEAIRMATANPAELFGEKIPTLEIGQPATFITFHLQPDASPQHDVRVAFAPAASYLNGQLKG